MFYMDNSSASFIADHQDTANRLSALYLDDFVNAYAESTIIL